MKQGTKKTRNLTVTLCSAARCFVARAFGLLRLIEVLPVLPALGGVELVDALVPAEPQDPVVRGGVCLVAEKLDHPAKESQVLGIVQSKSQIRRIAPGRMGDRKRDA